ncbi:hypothetical protein ESCNG_80068 [Neisseria gonorrhoeae]|nr:hypothetical protein ESCNG_80068 [Neisseria gonorrhoeae]
MREQDSNLRPSGYEPDELPCCSIPRQKMKLYGRFFMLSNIISVKNHKVFRPAAYA